MSSANMSSSDRVCYVHCNFCNTVLAVSVPSSSMLSIVTVRCGHCANLLSVNIAPLLHSLHLQHFQVQKQQSMAADASTIDNGGSSSNYCNRSSSPPLIQLQHDQLKTTPICPPSKRQRVPSAYNRFIKEEIQRIKASNPEISHRQAFSAAAKNWAHFPHIHFGLKFGDKADA